MYECTAYIPDMSCDDPKRERVIVSGGRLRGFRFLNLSQSFDG
jgi:hypothetical protein